MESIVEKNILQADAAEAAKLSDIASAMEKAILTVAQKEVENKNPDEINNDIYKLVVGEHVYREFQIGDLTFKIADMKLSDINTLRNFIINNLRDMPQDYVERFNIKISCAISLQSVTRGDIPVKILEAFPSEADLSGPEAEKYLKEKARILVDRQNYIESLPPSLIQRILEESLALNRYIQAIIRPEVVGNF